MRLEYQHQVKEEEIIQIYRSNRPEIKNGHESAFELNPIPDIYSDSSSSAEEAEKVDLEEHLPERKLPDTHHGKAVTKSTLISLQNRLSELEQGLG